MLSSQIILFTMGVCSVCGGEIPYHRQDAWSKSHGRGKYCSKECYYKSRGDPPVEITCLCGCGRKRLVQASRVKQGNGKFFSKECVSKYKREHRPWITCAFPGCSNKFQVMPWELNHKINSSARRYCDEHKGTHNPTLFKNGEEHPLWNGGISFGKYCPKFRDVRPRVRAFFNFQCMMPGCTCGGFTKDSNPQPVVHHVYYQKEACCYQEENGNFVFDLGKYGEITVEGDPTKFVTLCGPAHSKTNKNRLYWAKYFENLINTKYGGKSYFTEEEYLRYLHDSDK